MSRFHARLHASTVRAGLCSLALLPIACSAEAPRGGRPPLDSAAFAGPDQLHAHAVLERTIFAIDVLGVDLWVGEETAAEVRRIAAGRDEDSIPGDSIALALLAARNGLAVARVERGISQEKFLENVGKDLDAASEARLIPASVARQVGDALPAWFEFLAERGLEEGDLMMTRVRGDTVRTVYRGADGVTLLDQTDPHGTERWLGTVGAYLAPESGLREGLIRSALEGS